MLRVLSYVQNVKLVKEIPAASGQSAKSGGDFHLKRPLCLPGDFLGQLCQVHPALGLLLQLLLKSRLLRHKVLELFKIRAGEVLLLPVFLQLRFQSGNVPVDGLVFPLLPEGEFQLSGLGLFGLFWGFSCFGLSPRDSR